MKIPVVFQGPGSERRRPDPSSRAHARLGIGKAPNPYNNLGPGRNIGRPSVGTRQSQVSLSYPTEQPSEVNTAAQTVLQMVETTIQDGVPPTGNQANNQPEPGTRHLAAELDALKEILLAVCANTGTAVPGAAPLAAQASTSKRERRREATRRRRANRHDHAARPHPGGNGRTRRKAPRR
ncbi:hypothetical protein Nepgr_003782 [Nepenthes gracilis]|uniref:Uncharacterized protein n=1 Tax=Nepenthes gracilis TaxID=150966 RepID=A0AAD3S058_NEPGR|nr:hypothetical protein Nepgr_003782 [Nepenthes gracilis]